ncbi:MAG: xanthine dehydrogenase family protein subunit M [Gammaproteobacteria bacterium]|jgi:CO/xanthine dehydrogenase FAD-binding subunit|nr:xanthine dehydrogenase family protein subunit M [Gammaproteobacteria bacterium]MBT4492300.1 xanthine dehydrogenase family protein subunit M [Gammaproteobacteria bacterium]MBT7369678.1 xanthine dehydrogenase family protein subunit M [Gammaproteobacteria bacterium]
MVSVVYEAPDTIEGAVTLLAGSDIPANVLAGGTDLIIQTRASRDAERLLVDVKKIPGMSDANLVDGALELGPSMSCAEFTARENIRAVYPGLVEAASLIGSTQVQGRASVGGNLCNSSPAADTIPALIVNSAECVIVGPGGERTVAVEDFVTGVGANCMEKGELLKLIRVPAPEANTQDAYLRFIPRTEMDIAVAGAGVSITLDDKGNCTAAKVAIGAVAPTAILVPAAAEALIGTDLNDDVLQVAADAATEASSPITDRRGTIEFRRHVVGVLVKRAIKIAADRVKGVRT